MRVFVLDFQTAVRNCQPSIFFAIAVVIELGRTVGLGY